MVSGDWLERYRGALDGKVALVTGAGRGIGRAIALGYAAAGAAVCCASRTLSEVEEAADAIQQRGGRGLAVRVDVVVQADVHQMVAACVDALGGLDILVLSAGISGARLSVMESDPAGWRATLETNLFGAYYCARAAIPHLIARGAGKIITIGSGIGHTPRAGQSDYACSKAALWALNRALAEELAQHSISVNELIPGPVATSMTAKLVEGRESVFGIESEWTKSPDDVVPLALFLATQPDVGPTAQSYSLMRRVG